MDVPKTVVCFGDSNTWGYDPATAGRFDHRTRWPGVLRQELGDGYHIIEEGLSGRTTVWDDPIEGSKNGHTYLVPCLGTHWPLDLIVIMLGTNDLKRRFSLSAYDIAEGARVLINTAQRYQFYGDANVPKVLLIAPPPVAKLTDFAEMFEGSEAKSQLFGKHYARVAEEQGCAFLDAGSVIRSSDLDGIHFEASEHTKLGHAVAAKVRELLG